jgi:murein DD-endopeptidase MepM/ murein hydrolase activator NlpD
MLCAAGAAAAPAYKYRDPDGHWVYTDRAPAADVETESLEVSHDGGSPLSIRIERRDETGGIRLVAVNPLLCPASVEMTLVESNLPGVSAGDVLLRELAPQSEASMIRLDIRATKNPWLKYRWTGILGPPRASHRPPRAYRVPYAVGSTYRISQAFPRQITHDTPESQYAIDFALPDGTPVYAARDGIVINARHDSFRGGRDPAMMDQANVIFVLHDDGTIGVYAHMHWDSIRVRIGQRVARGEYLANSGSTGFSTGPHLHFAVIRNGGNRAVSVPVEFAGPTEAGVAPVDQASLEAY